MTNYERMLSRYQAGETPWHSDEPPPEVAAAVAELQPGRALDLGCGYGRSSIYLAQHGWQVDGVDFIPLAIERAKKQAAGLGLPIGFHVGDVTDLFFLREPYDLILDVGCGHALLDEQMPAYHAQIKRLLKKGGLYLLYARLRKKGDEVENGPRGLVEKAFLQLFTPTFTLQKAEHNMTHMENGHSWESAWYWFTPK